MPGSDDKTHVRLGEGDVFGESCLLTNEPRRADVVADGHLVALRIPKQTLSYLVRIVRYLTWHEKEPPFPFGEFPAEMNLKLPARKAPTRKRSAAPNRELD